MGPFGAPITHDDTQVDTLKVTALAFGTGDSRGMIVLYGKMYAPEIIHVELSTQVNFYLYDKEIAILPLVEWLREAINVFADVHRRLSLGGTIEEVRFRSFA